MLVLVLVERVGSIGMLIVHDGAALSLSLSGCLAVCLCLSLCEDHSASRCLWSVSQSAGLGLLVGATHLLNSKAGYKRLELEWPWMHETASIYR